LSFAARKFNGAGGTLSRVHGARRDGATSLLLEPGIGLLLETRCQSSVVVKRLLTPRKFHLVSVCSNKTCCLSHAPVRLDTTVTGCKDKRLSDNGGFHLLDGPTGIVENIAVVSNRCGRLQL
jgi:hypothetical protein